MENLNFNNYEFVEANNLNEAFDKLEKGKGKGSIEIFKEPARKYYKELI